MISLQATGQVRKRTFTQREIGLFAGASYYLGDINPRTHVLYSDWAAGAFFRYASNYRYAFRFGLNYGNVYGRDRSSKEPDQRERNLNFRTKIYEAHAIAEFNFVEYRIGHEKHRFTMFVFAGLGAFYFNPEGNLGSGYVPLRPKKFERASYSLYQVCVPFGLGFKWNIKDKYGIGIEWGPRKIYTDYLDDVSGTYPDVSGDASANTSQIGAMRGNPSTKDWYFFYGVTFTVKLRDPKSVCHGNSRR
jgi:hypothetical protein